MVGFIGLEERAAYDLCMEGVTLPDKIDEPVAHLQALSACYNVVGKQGWGCKGKRRECGAGLCCGKQYILEKAIDYTCEPKEATKVDNYNFVCLDGDKTAAKKLIATAAALMTAAYALV